VEGLGDVLGEWDGKGEELAVGLPSGSGDGDGDHSIHAIWEALGMTGWHPEVSMEATAISPL
jgi:hypothetical protein